MSFLDNLYTLKNDFDSILESSENDESSDKIKELEERIEAIKKKETRGFISDEEADEALDDISKKLEIVKERVYGH